MALNVYYEVGGMSIDVGHKLEAGYTSNLQLAKALDWLNASVHMNPPITLTEVSLESRRHPLDASVILGALSECRDAVFLGPNSIEKLACVNRSVVGGYTNLGVASYIADADVGRYCSIGARVSIGGYEHPLDWVGTASYQWGKSASDLVDDRALERLRQNQEPVQLRTRIGSDVWIGDNAVVRRGVVIGNGVVVGAGSVVTKDVPDYAIVVGAPARVLRFRFPENVRVQLARTCWWNMDLEELSTFPLSSVEKFLDSLKGCGTSHP